MELHRLGIWGGSLIVAALAGCGSGSDGSANVSLAAPVGAVTMVTATRGGDGAYAVEYWVADLSEDVELALDVSQDRGGTYSAATVIDGQRELGVGDTTGRLAWDAAADLGAEPQGDIVLRLTPYGARSGLAGTPAFSAPFAYGINTPPEILACDVVATPSGGPVALRLTARDVEGDVVTVAGSFSLDGGATWSPAVLTSAEGATLSLLEAAATFSLAWDATVVGEGTFPAAAVAVEVADAAASSRAESATFSLMTYRPAITGITIEDIPDYMNGSATFTNLDDLEEAFHLLVPHWGFHMRVSYEAHERGVPVDPATLAVTVSRALGPAGEIAAGTDLGPLFLAGQEEAILAVTESLSFPAGSATITATVADNLGNRSEPWSYTVVAEASSQAVRPFAATDTWYIDCSRDYWTVASSVSGGRVTITTTFRASGRADFLDDLWLLGLYNADEPALSERVVALVKERLLVNLREFYAIEADGSRGADSPAISFSASQRGTSAIAVGGADPAGGYTLGRAYFDRGNLGREQNTSSGLGIFSTNLIRFYINVSYSFKERFDPFIPGRGSPIGTLSDDATILADDFVPGAPENAETAEARYADLADAADGFGRALAAILAHEVGHSVGLVANGPPPEGLFGGESNASFSGYWTDPYHFDCPGNNIMEASMSFSTMLYRGSQALVFNALERAYLLQRILLAR